MGEVHPLKCAQYDASTVSFKRKYVPIVIEVTFLLKQTQTETEHKHGMAYSLRVNASNQLVIVSRYGT